MLYRCLFLLILAPLLSQSQEPLDPAALVHKIQAELSGPFPPPEGNPDPKLPHGQLIEGTINDSKIYPGTENHFQIYVPAQYNPAHPACLLVKLDGLGSYEATVLDNLIAGKEVPVIIGVGIVPGAIWKDPPGTPNRRAYRYDRSYEFDSINDHFPDFVLNELLPAVQRLKTQDGRLIRVSPNGNDHAATGGSTGGIGSFTLAWRRPDQFTRVYSVIGTYVSMRGGNDYPAMIRKTDPKPLRIFLEDGSADAWNPLFGSWFDANLNMESALTFSGYDVAHAWGTHGHDGRPGQVIFPDVMRWLWRDYPASLQPGISNNSTLQEITLNGENWRELPQVFHNAAGLAADGKGQVVLGDSSGIYHLSNGASEIWQSIRDIAAQAFGPDGSLYAVLPKERKVVSINPQGEAATVSTGIVGHSITVNHSGALFVSEPGAHNDEPSHIWKIENGKRESVDHGLSSASGVAFSPDGSLFFAAEQATQWVYSYIVTSNGSFADKQPFYWLHMTDIPNNSGAQDLTVDTHGNLYVATRMGIQVCDQNGRVRAILPLPSPAGPVRSLCFGGEHFDVLYATDGTHVFVRHLKLPGFPQWAAPIVVKSQGAG